MKQRARTTILISLFIALLVASAGFAQAKTITVWPGSFRATDPDVTGYAISQEAIQGPSTDLVFDAPLNLPVGSTLTSAVMSWRGLAGATVQCRIMRKPLVGSKELIAIAWPVDLPSGIDWTAFPLTFQGVDPVIRKNYHYYIEVDLYKGLSYFGGLKVNYTPAP